MKKIIFIISITLLAFNSQAQGTLQFNQVLTFAQDTSFTINSIASLYPTWDIYTVPASRVVKITKAINNQSVVNNGCSVNDFYFTINGVKTTHNTDLEDAWIKEGDIIGVLVELQVSCCDASWYCTRYDNLFISLIEYNIIPE